MAQAVVITSEDAWPEPRLLLWWLSLLTAAAATGLAAGVVVKRVVAAPATALLWWGLLAWSAATPWATLRALAGVPTLVVCCSSNDMIDQSALNASVTFYAALTLAALVIVAGGTSRGVLLAKAATVVALGLASGVLFSRGLDVNPFVPRDDPVSCLTQSGRTMCAWPEHWSQRADYGRAIEREARALTSLSLDVPSVWSEQCDSVIVGCISMAPAAPPAVQRGAVVQAVLSANGLDPQDPVAIAAVLRVLGEPVEALRDGLIGSEIDEFNATLGMNAEAIHDFLSQRRVPKE